MSLFIVRATAGALILFLGRELNFLFAAAMAAFIGLRLIPLLPTSWPSWSDYAFIAALGIAAAILTIRDRKVGYYVTGFLVGGYLFNEIYAPGSLFIPILPFIVGSVLGAVIIGMLGEWGMIIISTFIGTYLIYGV
ncbi:MAG TPA: hypothetical protein DCX53_04290, partial [Anaerolineae bacterium]|nr:hypothetical protein [Anaerolineae bacterium]